MVHECRRQSGLLLLRLTRLFRTRYWQYRWHGDLTSGWKCTSSGICNRLTRMSMVTEPCKQAEQRNTAAATLAGSRASWRLDALPSPLVFHRKSRCCFASRPQRQWKGVPLSSSAKRFCVFESYWPATCLDCPVLQSHSWVAKDVKPSSCACSSR